MTELPFKLIQRAEKAADPVLTQRQAASVQRALENAGVIFVEGNDDESGVRLRKER